MNSIQADLSKISLEGLDRQLFQWSPEFLSIFGDNAVQEVESQDPKLFTIGGSQYTHIPQTVRFYHGSFNKPHSVGDTIDVILKEEFQTAPLRHVFLPEMAYIGESARNKIYRAAQYHYKDRPEPTQTSDELAKLFLYIRKNSLFDWATKAAWDAALWGCNGDYRMAAALIGRYGLIKYSYIEPRITSTYRLTKQKDGILIEITADHPIQERISAALSAAILTYKDLKRRNQSILLSELNKTASMGFYTHKNTSINMPKAAKQKCLAVMLEYLEGLIETGEPSEFPSISEPRREPKAQHLLYWDSIIQPPTEIAPTTKEISYRNFLNKTKNYKSGDIVSRRDIGIVAQTAKAWLYFGFIKVAEEKDKYIILEK